MAFGIWSYAIRIGVWQADSSMDNCTWGFSWLNSPVRRMGRSRAKKQAVTSLLEGNEAGGVGGAVNDGLPAAAAILRSRPIRRVSSAGGWLAWWLRWLYRQLQTCR